ncbi:hypothetical protein [uncultured Shimia sp.]|nr:hypothetical protein [uncultured Shimia sp.]
MRKPEQSAVMGQFAPTVKWTKAAAVLLATAISIPVFLVLTAIDVLFL